MLWSKQRFYSRVIIKIHGWNLPDSPRVKRRGVARTLQINSVDFGTTTAGAQSKPLSDRSLSLSLSPVSCFSLWNNALSFSPADRQTTDSSCSVLHGTLICLTLRYREIGMYSGPSCKKTHAHAHTHPTHKRRAICRTPDCYMQQSPRSFSFRRISISPFLPRRYKCTFFYVHNVFSQEFLRISVFGVFIISMLMCSYSSNS